MDPVPDRVCDLGLERPVAVAQQHRIQRVATEVSATARSRWPSPLKSPATMARGSDPHRVGDLGLERAVAVAQQHRDARPWLHRLNATARSSRPSPLKSPATMASGDRTRPRR